MILLRNAHRNPMISMINTKLKEANMVTAEGILTKDTLLQISQKRLSGLLQNNILMKATMLDPRLKKMYFDIPLHVKNVTDEIIKQMVEKKQSEILPSSVGEMDCGEQDMVALSIQESFLDLHNRTIELRDSESRVPKERKCSFSTAFSC